MLKVKVKIIHISTEYLTNDDREDKHCNWQLTGSDMRPFDRHIYI